MGTDNQLTSSSSSCSNDRDDDKEIALIKGICRQTETKPTKLTNLLCEEPTTSDSEPENNTNSLEDSFNKTLDFMEADLEDEIANQIATPLNSQKSSQKSCLIDRNKEIENFTFTPIKLPNNRCSKVQAGQRTKRSSCQMIESPVAVNPLKSKLMTNKQRIASSESCESREKLRKIGENEKFPKSQSFRR